MTLLIIAIVTIVVLYFIFKHLISQSKKPQGIIGKLMMKTWNNAYFPMVKWSLNGLPVESNLDILDIGIGNGLSSQYLFSRFPAAKLHGIDISEEAIKQSRKRFVDESASFQVQTIENTDFSDEKFDLICAFQTHFHWEKLKESFVEIERILKPEGKLLLACEMSKLKIYLPELNEQGSFDQFLAKANLVIESTNSDAGFISYEIRKFPSSF